MTVLEWSNDLKLGVPAMDSDHRHLLQLTNDFLSAARQSAAFSRLTLILGELIARTRIHFGAEETLLDRAGYPGLAGHRAQHVRLLVEAQRLYERFQALDAAPDHDETASRDLTIEAAKFLQRWLVDHIKAEDRPYRPYVLHLT
ncbi:hemerythrin sipunculid [Paramagnetospirillum magnetotacticum MS-1]|uniref:Hemerythrin sipunculid n=1 Tax=Paramagnetospirillum magnetotacticum MS-1 TaxID=272627 RepID=A0A0C2YVI9_PARME|nr:bacteriohemerythrin [Paramagnetospirillum magnetotacticum]KIL98720.1 hemerythrin sipunculid [Paramagnetospirillum magnetotacticum MS-1]